MRLRIHRGENSGATGSAHASTAGSQPPSSRRQPNRQSATQPPPTPQRFLSREAAEASGKRGASSGGRPSNGLCCLARGAGAGVEGSLSAAAALFSQSENIPEVARPRALKGVDPGRRWDSPSPLLGGACPAAARCASPPPLVGLGFTRASLHPSPGRAALGLCLYLTKTSCCAAIGTCIGDT